MKKVAPDMTLLAIRHPRHPGYNKACFCEECSFALRLSSCYEEREIVQQSGDDEEYDPWCSVIENVFEEHHDLMEERYRELENLPKEGAITKVSKTLPHQLLETIQEKFVGLIKTITFWRKHPMYNTIQ